jgi:hypothetical protein
VGGATAAAFAAATFLGAFLLFLVQPLAGKFVLPWFGGGPAVWTGCLLFFQVVLLAGYAYAHLGVSRLSARAQGAVHVALLAVAAVALVPFAAHRFSQPPAPSGTAELAPLVQILGFLAASVGLPSLALSATSPLLNAWYARAAPAAGPGVYRLYAVSNAGSLLALVAYPFGVEPALSRRTQAVAWSAGFAAFAVLCGYCALRSTRRSAAGGEEGNKSDTGGPPAPRSTLPRRLLWVALPACASVLLLATTNTMTNDVAAVPLLWVLPLALYLLTFVVAFEGRRPYRRRLGGVSLVMAAAGVCWVLLGADVGLPVAGRVAVLAAAMFVCCMVCHGELSALRPPPRELTAYYLSVAAGGALGGVLVAVAAPLVLDRYLELHLGLWACCLLALVTPYLAPARGVPPYTTRTGLAALLGVAGLVVLAAVLWAARDPYPVHGARTVGRYRDFFGVVTVYELNPDDPRRACRVLRHAGVTHGGQFVAPERRREPSTYYGPGSGIAAAFRTTAGAPRRVGIVGLGAGTVAAFGAEGDFFRCYELSPTVERIAREQFTYLADSAANWEVVLGDARLSLEREPPQRFDLLALDAFSGHAIPVHLLTAEAFALYRRHLAPGGVIVVNVSNRYVDVEPVVARQAERGGWQAVVISNEPADGGSGLLGSDWVLLTDDAARTAAFRAAGGRPPRTNPTIPPWTDDYASLYHVLRH